MSRAVPTGARPERPREPERGLGDNGEGNVPGAGRGDGPKHAYGPSGRGDQWWSDQGPDVQGVQGVQGAEDIQGGGQDAQRYPGQGYNGQGYNGQGYNGQGYSGQGYGNPGYSGRPRAGQGDPEQGWFDRQGYPPPGGQDPAPRGYGGPAPSGLPRRPGRPGYPGPPGSAGRPGQRYGGAGQGYEAQGYEAQGYEAQGYGDSRYGDQGYARPGYPGPGFAEQPTQAYAGYQADTGTLGHSGAPGAPGASGASALLGELAGPGAPGAPGGPNAPDGPDAPRAAGRGERKRKRKARFRRTRRLARLRSVRIVGALLGVFLIWVMFSVGQALTANNGQSMSSNLAEWARDHYLGPVVTFGEWLSYNPPKTGGKPSFSLAVPKGQQVSKHHIKGFTPDVPATLQSLAGSALPGEGQWRVVETVKGEPAIFTTFLRDARYTSYVNGIASMDQRLVSFQLHPGSEDPGPGNWGSWGSTSIKPGSRTGLLATFNGGFKLDSAGGGFYLNGEYHGSLVNGAASIVYYKDGTLKIGAWGRDLSMSSSVEGVRQNLKLLVDHGKVAADASSNVVSNWGATLGGGYYVWRSGLGITKDGRVIFVYGPALNAQDLGLLLQRAGAVEGLQLDINPYWMKYEYYNAKGHPSDPTPVNLLPTQQQSAYSYYSAYTRDFTAVYAR